MTKRVVVVQESLRRYRVPFYELLQADLAKDGVTLELLHSNPPHHLDVRGDPGHVDWAVNVPSREIQVGTRTLVWQSVLGHVRGADLVVVEQAASMLVNPVLLANQRLGGPPVAFWGHGRHFDDATASRPGEMIKRWQSRRPHWWFAYTDETADLVADLGFPKHRITTVRNATDTRALSQAIEQVSDSKIVDVRRELGMDTDDIVVFVGALSRPKNLPMLVDAGRHAHAQLPSFRLVVVGGGDMPPPTGDNADTSSWLRVVGPRFGDELAATLKVAKVLAVPGWAGLVVTDGFAAQLPVVISDALPHPPEAAYVEHGVNGIRVPTASPTDYAEALVTLLTDDAQRRRLARGAGLAAQQYSIEMMAKRFAQGLRGALENA